jgi:hypothetical protein
MKNMLSKCICFLAIYTIFYNTVNAKELAAMASIKQQNNRIEIITSDNELVAIELIKNDVVRVWAGVNEQLIDAKNNKAKIVLPYQLGNVDYKLSDHDSYHLLQTSQLALRIYKNPLKC